MKRIWFLIPALAVALIPGVLSQNEGVSVPIAESPPAASHAFSLASNREVLSRMTTGSESLIRNLQAASVEVGLFALSVSDVPVMSAVTGDLLSLPLNDDQRPVPDRPRDDAILSPAPEFEPPRASRRRLPEPKAARSRLAVRMAKWSPVRVV